MIVSAVVCVLMAFCLGLLVYAALLRDENLKYEEQLCHIQTFTKKAKLSKHLAVDKSFRTGWDGLANLILQELQDIEEGD